MHIVHVFVEVKPEYLEEFINATLENAKASIDEPGIARFDFLQDTESTNRFVLIEVYRTKDDPASHKRTEHYQNWRDSVEKMMATPRTRMVLENMFPEDKGWG